MKTLKIANDEIAQELKEVAMTEIVPLSWEGFDVVATIGNYDILKLNRLGENRLLLNLQGD